MAKRKYYLSKSTFLKGLQCEKALYFHKHHYKLKDEITETQQAIFDQGNSVGELAHQLFPGGINCQPEVFYEYNKALASTKQALDHGRPVIYEAAFFFNGVFVYADILVEDEEGWKVYEVKSSTSVKEVNIQDAALQSYVIEQNGIKLKDVCIVHLDNTYERDGELQVEALFTKTSVLSEIKTLSPRIPKEIERLKAVIDRKTLPEKSIGAHCSSPYTCDFMGQCWGHIPEDSIFDVGNLRTKKKFELYDQGIVLIKDIPDAFELSDKQRMQVEGVKNNTSYVDSMRLNQFLDALHGPLYFLDFETMGSGVPLFDRTRPYQQIPFQYSLHVQDTDQIKHFEFLAETDGTDPRISFIKQLILDCRSEGDILVYNISFEQSKIEELIQAFPGYQVPLEGIIRRLKDLMIPFQKGWYYTPEMKGSYSIKQVLPALVPELSYKQLNINEGGTASTTFAAMANGTFDGGFEQTRIDLLEYCKMDTYAMVEILRVLRDRVKEYY